jgi:hypothetical protein
MPQTLVLEAIPFALAGTLTTLSANADPSVRASLPVCPAQTLAWPSFRTGTGPTSTAGRQHDVVLRMSRLT